jgi:gamma-glutamyl hercynylcysteine S-oxide synthase
VNEAAHPAAQARAAAVALHDADAARRAGRDALSLALMDARNHLLALLGVHETAATLRIAAEAGAWQERWISRHVQRARGEAADPAGPLLAGIEPALEAWLEGELPPPPDGLRGYLAETLEITLELLAHAEESAAGLHFYRAALLHEDRLGEALAEQAAAAKVLVPPARAEREPIWLPAQRWPLGSARPTGDAGAYVPHNERWAHEVRLPEFEIDAQAVNWRQYAEFAEDGGYDRRECWSDEGWAWLLAGARRAPLRVEQLSGGVLAERGGKLQRVPAQQPVLHVSRHEAEAWCRWAGRRLPTEPEWELAASSAASRGFVWGDVFEWVAGSARAWPDAGSPGAGCLDPIPPPGTMGVLRGGSFASRSRCKHPKARRFAPPVHDVMFCGFRSCAL